MTRIEIYNKMKALGMKHYILAAKRYSDEKGRYTWIETERLHRCHYTDKSFDEEVSRLDRLGFNFIDAIHLHE